MKPVYAIVGTGAVGGYYGGLLQRAGFEVHFLLRGDYRHVLDHGLRIESVRGNFALPDVAAWNDARRMPPCDVAVITVKTTANRMLPDLLPPLKPGGTVLMLQNGLGNEDDAAALVAPDRVLGGLSFLCCHKAGPGLIRHLDYGSVTIAAHRADGRPAGLTDRVRQVAEDFAAAGIEVHPDLDLQTARWRKLVWNVPFNGLSVVLDATTDRFIRDPDAAALCGALMREVELGAAACGHPIAPGFIDQMMDDTRRMTPYRTSMMIDYEAGRAMEIEYLYDRPLAAAAARGAALPRMDALRRMLHFLDRRRTARPTGNAPGGPPR